MQTSYFFSKTDIWTGVSKKTTNVAVFFYVDTLRSNSTVSFAVFTFLVERLKNTSNPSLLTSQWRIWGSWGALDCRGNQNPIQSEKPHV